MTQYVFASECQDADALAASALDALNAGNSLAAANLYQRASALRPNEPIFYNNGGVAMMRLGRLEDAERAFRRAIALQERYVDPIVNLANVIIKEHERREREARPQNTPPFTPRLEEAERLLTRALQIGGERLDALLFLALLLERKGELRECVATLERARPLHPDQSALNLLVADVSAKGHDWANAAEMLERVIQTRPERRELQERAGEFCGRLGRWARSREHFRRAAALVGPRSALRWKFLGYSPVYFPTNDAIEEYWRTLDATLDEALDDAPVFEWRALMTEGFVPPFQLAHLDRCCRAIKEKFARLYAPTFDSVRVEPARRRPAAKAKIGYYATPRELGGLLRSMSGVINRLDSKRFESIIFHHPGSEDFLRRALPSATLVNISNSFETAADRIRETKCDAIYYWKVGGAQWNYFLPMLRLAPIQATSWGVHGTSAVFEIDYFLSYNLAEIPTAQEHYTEKLVLLNEAPAFQPRQDASVTSAREELGLPSSGALYFCQQRLAKYHPIFDEYLKGVLEADATGQIIALIGDRNDYDAESIRARINRTLGATLAKRMIFLPRLSMAEYDKYLSAATVALDSAVYSGCLTLYDALSRGIPCVSRVGELLVQRFPVSAYVAMAIDAPPLAQTREEYVRIATELGTNTDARRALTRQILERREQVFERVEAVREFERFWERALWGEP